MAGETTNKTIGEDAAATLELLREEAALYDQLERLAARQRTCVSGDDSTQLLAVLSSRQKIADDLLRLGRQLLPVRKSWPTLRRCLDEGQRKEAEALIERTSETLKRIMSADEEDARILSARKEMIACGLRATHAPRQALAAYGGSKAANGSYGRLDQAS